MIYRGKSTIFCKSTLIFVKQGQNPPVKFVDISQIFVKNFYVFSSQYLEFSLDFFIPREYNVIKVEYLSTLVVISSLLNFIHKVFNSFKGINLLLYTRTVETVENFLFSIDPPTHERR